MMETKGTRAFDSYLLSIKFAKVMHINITADIMKIKLKKPPWELLIVLMYDPTGK